jgi:hypothetical protein
VIFCEVASNNADETTKLLTSASYCLFKGEKSLTNVQMVNHATYDTIAVPEEKKYRMLRLIDCPMEGAGPCGARMVNHGPPQN